MEEYFNIITATDSYKLSHWNMYPEGTTKVYSYFESRQGAYFPSTTFFGLQYLIKKYLTGVVVTRDNVARAKWLVEGHMGSGAVFNEKMWNHIIDVHGGKLPVRIMAVPEGTEVPTGNVLMTIENTDPECAALTNHLETLLTHVWSASTVATKSKAVKTIIRGFLQDTADSLSGLDFMLHDFGYRGVSSQESAAFQGAGHLVNFMGTDTIAAMEMIMNYYNETEVPAYSVPATEHSIMTALGKSGEERVVRSLLENYPTGILSMVIDSYNYLDFVKMCGTDFREAILARDGVVVFRPDSGDPCKVTIQVLNMLAEMFGYTTNSKEYRVLNPKVKVLWGDGIDISGVQDVLGAVKAAGFSAENMVFGMGGGLLQKVNRDTQCFAFKSSYQERNGVGYDIYKDPIDGTKKSKRGRLALVRGSASYVTVPESELGMYADNILEVVFENGALVRDMSFNDIRCNANKA